MDCKNAEKTALRRINDAAANPVEPGVMPEREALYRKFVEVVGKRLHSFDNLDMVGRADSLKQLEEIEAEWINRYQNEPSFHAKVQALAADLLHACEP